MDRSSHEPPLYYFPFQYEPNDDSHGRWEEGQEEAERLRVVKESLFAFRRGKAGFPRETHGCPTTKVRSG